MLDQRLAAADDEEDERDHRHTVEDVDAVHPPVIAPYARVCLPYLPYAMVALVPEQAGAKKGVARVAVMVYLPREVIDWLDAKAAVRFKRRATHLADVIVSLYERDRKAS